MNMGWIKLHRPIREHWIWQDPVKFKWWIDILLTVNHKDNKVNIGNQLFECKRGQSIMSLQNWADRWNTSKDSTRNFMRLLENDGMIIHENLTKTTRLTVCNYDNYQDDLHADQTQSKRKPNADQTHGYPNKNNKECIKNEKEGEQTEFYPFSEFWKDYDKKVNSFSCEKKWSSVSKEDRELIKQYIPKYKLSQPDKQYRKNPETFLNQKAWNNELVYKDGIVKKEAEKIIDPIRFQGYLERTDV